MAGKLTKQEKSWILYDVGNSAFVLLATALIPVYFKTLAEPGSSVVVAWGYAETVASLLLALLMPVLGSLADLKGNKKKFFIAPWHGRHRAGGAGVRHGGVLAGDAVLGSSAPASGRHRGHGLRRPRGELPVRAQHPHAHARLPAGRARLLPRAAGHQPGPRMGRRLCPHH